MAAAAPANDDDVDALVDAMARRAAAADAGASTSSAPPPTAEGVEWRANWEPATGLPAALDAATASRDNLRERLGAPARTAGDKKRAAEAHARIPEREVTADVKRDFRLLRLRGVMDPKRFYRGADDTKIPKRFQWGTVVEGPTEFYSSRIAKRDRRTTFTEEIMADASVTDYRRRKFAQIQEKARAEAPKRRAGGKPQRKVRRRTSHKGYRG